MTNRAPAIVMFAYVALATGIVLSIDAIPQPLSYHAFADDRRIWGIDNFFNVISNAAFLVPGIAGLALCLRRPPAGARWAWTAVFLGVCAVVAGSSYYHLAPGNERLFWDRLPMTVGFSGLFVAMIDEHFDRPGERILLLPALAVGVACLLHWAWIDDLRAYFWVQAIALGTLVAVTAAFPDGRGERKYLIAAAIAYGGAVVSEQADTAIHDVLGGALSGHTVKHLLAALALYQLYRMLRDRARG